MMMTRDDYLALRRRYEPDRIRLSEPLFAARMKQLGICPCTKEDDLREFQQRGWVLVDATYEPVNQLTGTAIDQAYRLLCDDLAGLMPERSVPPDLDQRECLSNSDAKAKGFNVLNGASVIYFPSSGRQKEFQQQFRTILKSETTAPTPKQ